MTRVLGVEEYTKKTNTGNDIIIRIQRPRTPKPGTTPDDGQDRTNPPPTAILFGWLGSVHKNLSKYSAIYQEMGYNTVQLIASPSAVFALNPKNSAVFLLSVLRVIAADERLTKGGIVFMLFSNGGAMFAPHIAAMFEGSLCHLVKADDELVVKSVKDAIAGIIFDSSPCYLHPSSGSTAINEGFRVPKGILRGIVHLGFALICLIQYCFIINMPKFFWTALRKAEYLAPELYLYSTVDRLVDIPYLEALIEERRQEKKQVRVFRVHDSIHCTLLRQHPEKYIEAIRNVNEWAINQYRRRVGMLLWDLVPNDYYSCL